MRKIHLLLLLMAIIPLLALQFSCATVEKKEAKEAAAEKPTPAEEAPEVSKLLGDTHKEAGITCKNCHEKMPPKDEIESTVCLTCHDNYKELTASNLDPHNSHVTYSRCTECHHMHKPSEVQCLACHEFDMKAP